VGVGWGCSSLFVLLTYVVLGVVIVSMVGVGVEIHDCNVSCDANIVRNRQVFGLDSLYVYTIMSDFYTTSDVLFTQDYVFYTGFGLD
jgi:hypothetical protein